MHIKRFIAMVLLCAPVCWPLIEKGWGEQKTSEASSPPIMHKDRTGLVRDPTELAIQMMEEVKRRQEALAVREAELRRKEEKLRALELDLQEALKQLGVKEQELLALKEQLSKEEETKLQALAKVFDAAPPEQGGRLLTELAPDTAAKVLERMNSRKAGRLWAFVDPQKAAQISEILTKSHD